MRDVIYLTHREVITIHDEKVIKRFGGAYGILNANALASAVAMPQMEVFGEELYPDMPAKAGILFYLLVQNHCFVDGNKRTAVVSLATFLDANGHELDTSDDELFQFAIDVATSALDKDQTIDWIRAHIVSGA